MTNTVTIPLEDHLNNIDKIKHLESLVNDKVAVIKIFHHGNIEPTYRELTDGESERIKNMKVPCGDCSKKDSPCRAVNCQYF